MKRIDPEVFTALQDTSRDVDVAEWINSILREKKIVQSEGNQNDNNNNNNNNNKTEQHKDELFQDTALTMKDTEYIGNVIHQLQAIGGNLHQELSDIKDKTYRRMPRVLLEIEDMAERSNAIKTHLRKLENRLDQIRTEHKDEYDTLQELHETKKKLEMCRNALHHAHRMDQLLSRVESRFQKQNTDNIQPIVQDIENIRESMLIVREYISVDKVEKRLEKFESQLFEVLSPILLNSLEKHDIDQSIKYSQMLERVGKRDETLKQYLNECIRQVKDVWDSYRPHRSTCEFLESFYKSLQQCIESEMQWMPIDITHSGAVVADFLSDYLRKLSSTTSSRLETLSLDEMQSCFNSTKSFSKHIISVIFPKETLNSKDPFIIESFSHLQSAIFQPYRPIHRKYPSLEKQRLLQKMKTMDLYSPPSTGNIVAYFDKTVPTFFNLLMETVERCLLFTQGILLKDILKTLGEVIGIYSQKVYRSSIGSSSSSSSSSQTRPSPRNTPRSYKQHKHHPQDRETIKRSLESLLVCLNVRDHFFGFRRRISRSIISEKDELLSSADAPLHRRNPMLINDNDAFETLSEVMSQIEESEEHVLSAGLRHINTIVNNAESAVKNTLLSPVNEQLENLHNMSKWREEPDPETFEVASFTPSPSNYIMRIGEHLVKILQEFDDLGFDGDESDPRHGQYWLDVVFNSTIRMFKTEIVRIRELTDIGCQQLHADLEYLANVLSTLSASEWPSVQHLIAVTGASEEQLQNWATNKSIPTEKRDLSKLMLEIRVFEDH